MSKARTLADFISDGSEFADGTISVAEVSGAAPLASPTFTGTVTIPTLTPTTITGGNISGDVRFGTNVNAIFGGGASDYLNIYSDGTNKYIQDTGSGSLFIRGSDLVLEDASGYDYIAMSDTGNGGSVAIKHSGDTKFITSTTGVEVTGKTTTDALDLTAIAKDISDTANDVFVYDTRKDSDGGAWRKRTQHTSWYNETLNTATRGSRKEFPAVAVIVAHGNDITIYDGDDPDLPLWMHFEGNYYFIAEGNISSVFALNGRLVTGCNGYDAYSCDFIEDVAYEYSSSSTGRYGKIALRNTTGVYNVNKVTVSSNGIVNRQVNDVAMTVLPNAPIDAATGLPVPTIAVATNGGVSVIKDDGTVVSGHTGVAAEHIMLHESGALVYGITGAGNDNFSLHLDSGNTTRDTFYDNRTAEGVYDTYLNEGSGECLFKGDKFDLALAQTKGLLQITEEPDFSTGLHNRITSDYNTGWMNGDIKLATLSDTDDTDVTGSELVTNGTFDSDITGWTARNSDATLSFQSGQLRVENANAALGEAYQSISLTAGVTYTFSANITAINTSHGQFFLGTGTTGTSSTVAGAQYNTTGVKSFTYTPTSSGTYYIILGHRGANVAGYYAQYDNISVRLAESDRSVNGNGLQVFGTVTKNPVATGADLVAYSGFDYGSGNYLKQPYNSDLNFGTGDFCFMGWANLQSTGGDSTMFASVAYSDGTTPDDGDWLYRRDSGTTNLRFYIRQSNVWTYVQADSVVSYNVWQHHCVLRQNGVTKIYINGEEVKWSNNFLNHTFDCQATGVTIGSRYTYAGEDTEGSLALWRISGTAPSPEQIARIYNDEKHLFTEGAQATLYGSSDSVTALAFDDTTNLLHVGTSAGRSVFQGLRRVDNTTTAVTAAISASNGLVADE